jgi:hypothetical protein
MGHSDAPPWFARGCEVSCGFIGAARCFQRQEGDCDVTNLLLRLYIAGPSATSRRAEQNLQGLQDVAKAHNGLEVEIIDVIKNPELAEQASCDHRYANTRV